MATGPYLFLTIAFGVAIRSEDITCQVGQKLDAAKSFASLAASSCASACHPALGGATGGSISRDNLLHARDFRQCAAFRKRVRAMLCLVLVGLQRAELRFNAHESRSQRNDDERSRQARWPSCHFGVERRPVEASAVSFRLEAHAVSLRSARRCGGRETLRFGVDE